MAAVFLSPKNRKSKKYNDQTENHCSHDLSCSFLCGLLRSECRAEKSRQASRPAPAAPTAKPAAGLPTTEEVDAALKRTLGYDPGVTWQIYEIKPAGVPGLADVLFAINKQATQHIYLSSGGQSAIIGELIPFGANPFAPARAKLQGAFGPSRGGPNPPIDIVEFSDLECPHCKKSQPILEKLAADFPQVRFIFQQFPLPASLHPWAMKAAQYADCAGQINKDAFWKYVDCDLRKPGRNRAGHGG